MYQSDQRLPAANTMDAIHYIGMMFCIFNWFSANALPVLHFALLIIVMFNGKAVCVIFSSFNGFLEQSLKMIEDRL